MLSNLVIRSSIFVSLISNCDSIAGNLISSIHYWYLICFVKCLFFISFLIALLLNCIHLCANHILNQLLFFLLFLWCCTNFSLQLHLTSLNPITHLIISFNLLKLISALRTRLIIIPKTHLIFPMLLLIHYRTHLRLLIYSKLFTRSDQFHWQRVKFRCVR